MSLQIVESPDDWRWQARNAIQNLEQLERALELTSAERQGALRAAEQGLPLAITPYYLSLCDPVDPRCPIRRQCVPTWEENLRVQGDLRDPLGEEAHEVAPHLVRRYPDRVLLLATDRCGVYCRFCTRSRMVGQASGATALARLEPAFEWLEAHPEVVEVIVSGGDPALMSSRRIGELLDRLGQVPTVQTVRFATRAPVTVPQRITADFCEALQRHPTVWVMTHFNHPKELTRESVAACRRLAHSGLPVMNQTVLLRQINDDAGTLETLFRGLLQAKVRPYYLLQADPVRGTAHLRTSLERGITLMEQLQGRVSGIALPKLIVDTPGGYGKVPVGPNFVVARGPGVTTLRTYRGIEVDYLDPPS